MSTRRDFLAGAGLTAFLSATHPLSMSAGPPNEPSSANEFGFSPGLIYLNTGSTGPTPRAVRDRVLDAWVEIEKNPVFAEYSLDGVLGWAEKVRATAAAFLGCATDELLITRSTSEGMNTVAQGMRLKAGDRVVTTDQEHTGGNNCWRYLAERRGILIDTVAIPAGEHNAQAIVQRLSDALKPETRVISVSHILYTTGLKMPVREISALARDRGLLCIVDGAQAAGSTPIDVKSIGCHAYATTSHKWLMGPKGVGMLYISTDASDEIKPIQWMGGKRVVDGSVGVAPLPNIVGLGAAIDIANDRSVSKIEAHNMTLWKRAWRGLAGISALQMMSPGSSPVASALLSFAVPSKVNIAALHNALATKHRLVTRAIDKRHFNGLRIAPHIFNTEADIDSLIAGVKAELG